MSAIASSLGDAAEKLGIKATSALEHSETGQHVLSLFGNKENELNLTPQGKAVGEMLQEYHRIKSVSLGNMSKPLVAVKDWHQNNDSARTTLPLDTATIGDIHAHATAGKFPIAQQTKALLDQDIDPKTGLSKNQDLTMKQMSLKIKGQARLAGLAGSVGDKMQHVSPLIASMLEHPDPRVNLNGHAVADIVSNELRDTQEVKYGNIKDYQSSSKLEMNKTFRTVNKFRQKAGISDQIPLLNTGATYTNPKKLEEVASKVLRTIQIPFVAIPHIGQYFHLGAAAPLQAVGKALLMMDKTQMSHTIDASGILANTEWDVIHSDLAARTGQIAKWTDKSTAASIISKTIHTPGFNWMRLKQLAASGAVGYHSAIFWAHNAMSGDKRAIAELTEMGINPQDVIKQGGKLTDEQLTKGVYHFTNNRFFFDKSIDRSLWSNKNFFLRSASMYHSFVSSETAFLRRELLKGFKAGDIKGLAQFGATLGIVFPAVAPMLKSAEILARTGSPQQAGTAMSQDYQNLTGQHGAKEAAATYIEMLAHIGAAGAALNYYNAIKGNRLANAVMGPMLGMAAQDTEDVVNAARGKSVKPLGRDLTQMIPVAGKPLSHQLFPTKKEESSSTGRIPRTRKRR